MIVSGRVQTDGPWCLVTDGAAATVSRLVARDLTVAEPPDGTPEAARWHHERVTYLRFSAGTPVTLPWQSAPDLRELRRFVFAHGEVPEAALGRRRNVKLEVRVGATGTAVDVPVFGVEPRRSGTTSAVYVDPALDLPGTSGAALDAQVTFTPDLFTTRRGSLDALVAFTPSGSGPWYAVEHGLAATPTVVQAVWHGGTSLVDSATTRLESVLVELRADRSTHVWVKLGSGLTGEHRLHLRALLGTLETDA